MKKTVRFMTSVAAVAVATAAIPFSAEASSNFEKKSGYFKRYRDQQRHEPVHNQRGICQNAG